MATTKVTALMRRVTGKSEEQVSRYRRSQRGRGERTLENKNPDPEYLGEDDSDGSDGTGDRRTLGARRDGLGVPVRDLGRSNQSAKGSSMKLVAKGHVLLDLFFRTCAELVADSILTWLGPWTV